MMKQLTQDAFYQYAFLSGLNITPDGKNLVFTKTMVDEANNDYTQDLVKLDRDTKETKVVFTNKRAGVVLIENDKVLVVKNDPEKKTVHTHYVWVDFEGNETVAFELPVAVQSLKVLNDEYYLASVGIDVNHPDFYLMSEEEKEALLKEEEENRDYLVFDEYPFVFNGAGVVNGNRTALFLVDRNTYEMKRITVPTMDVESFDFEGDKVLYSGTDFETFKGKWAWIYEYDVNSGETTVLYDKKVQIGKVLYLKGEVFAICTFAKDYGAMEANKFYTVKNGEMTLVYDQEYSMHGGPGSDCRFGRGKAFMKDGDVFYMVATDKNDGILFEYADNELKPLTSFEGSVDDFVLTDKGFCFIAMVGQKLQEVYTYENGELTCVTSFNDEVLKDVYVAEPKHVAVNKPTVIDGWVLEPKDYDPTRKYPLILNIHGGPKAAYGTIFYHEMQYWANLGYFVCFCNPRGSDGKGNEFADLRRNFGKIDYEDIMDFVDEVLKTYPAIDEERMGVTGGSYGGYMTNWIIGHTNRFKAAATQRSISNWITEVCASDYGIDFPIEQEFDDLFNCHDELWDMSPLKYANNAVTPTLFIHSTEDYRCTFPEALQLYTVLKCKGVESRLVGFKGENHELSRGGKPKHRSRRLYEITEWMNKHLKQGE